MKTAADLTDIEQGEYRCWECPCCGRSFEEAHVRYERCPHCGLFLSYREGGVDLEELSYRFPTHKDAWKLTLQQAMAKVSEESHELMFAVLDGEGDDRVVEEALDTIHACETLLRRYPAECVAAAMDAVVEKNRARSYYEDGVR